MRFLIVRFRYSRTHLQTLPAPRLALPRHLLWSTLLWPALASLCLRLLTFLIFRVSMYWLGSKIPVPTCRSVLSRMKSLFLYPPTLLLLPSLLWTRFSTTMVTTQESLTRMWRTMKPNWIWELCSSMHMNIFGCTLCRSVSLFDSGTRVVFSAMYNVYIHKYMHAVCLYCFLWSLFICLPLQFIVFSFISGCFYLLNATVWMMYILICFVWCFFLLPLVEIGHPLYFWCVSRPNCIVGIEGGHAESGVLQGQIECSRFEGYWER